MHPSSTCARRRKSPASRPRFAILEVALAGAAGALLLASPVFGYYSADPDGDLAPTALEAVSDSDAYDPGSVPESLFYAGYGVPVCSDSVDNDGDGSIDGADLGCTNTDSDAVPLGFPLFSMDDATEQRLGSCWFCPSFTPENQMLDLVLAGPPYFVPGPGLTCMNGSDDDGDLLVDALDPDCVPDYDFDNTPNSSDTEGPYPNLNGAYHRDDCDDGEDNDGDGLSDLADPGCVAGSNVDGDGLADAFDTEGPQFNYAGVGGTDDCFDGVDNDGDTLLDLAEPGCLTCAGAPATVSGTAGDDVLVGTSGNDVIVGFGGNDRIRGLAGVDIVCAGPGDDRVAGGPDNDVLLGGEGDDRLNGGSGNDGLIGDFGNDRLVGGADNDFLADDADTAPYGDDLLSGGPGDDQIEAYGGVNTIRGGGDNDGITVSDGVNLIVAGGGNDAVNAAAGNNTIRGGGGDDTLLGGSGTDGLNGGGGTDFCSGGDGLTDTATPNCETVVDVP